MKKRIILVVTIIVMLIVGLLNLTGCNNKNNENNSENKIPVGLYRLVYTGNAEGEYVEETAVRETYEESGYNVKLSNIICLYNKVLNGNPIIGIIFKSQIIDGDLKFDKEEISEARWFTPDEILGMEDSLRSKEALLKSIENYHMNLVWIQAYH